MDIYTRKSQWKIVLIFAALVIIAASLLYTNRVARQIAAEEKKRVELWAKAMDIMIKAPDGVDLTFASEVLESNATIPAIVTDQLGRIVADNNLGVTDEKNEAAKQRILNKMKDGYPPIMVNDKDIGKQYIYYKNSSIYDVMTYYPYFQLGLLFLLLLVGYAAFSNARRAEQNLVWVGMAKETAHQLGTPISSQLAWIEHLKTTAPHHAEVQMIANELLHDIDRLELVAERFSKIGAKPELQSVNLLEVLDKNLSYIKPRASRRVTFDFPDPKGAPIYAMISPLLFDWVIENLLKNALDAMDGSGEIDASIVIEDKYTCLDISDTGKGIPKSRFKTIFEPGYSTKKRGWGLGLTLTKRIVEKYHGGKIFVKSSVIDKGTTFRIQLRKG